MNILIRTLDGTAFYVRPDSTMIRALTDYYIPDYVTAVNAVPFFCFRSARSGKAVREQFAHRYIGEFSCGILLKCETASPDSIYRTCMENAMDYTTVIPYDLLPADRIPEYISSKRPLTVAVNGHEKVRIEKGPDMATLSSAIAMITGYCSLRTGDFVGIELSGPVRIEKEQCLTAAFGISGKIRIEIK